MERLTERENDKLIMVKQDNGEYIPAYWDEDNFKAIKKLADYEDLEERLHKIFGEESTFSLADVIDALEMKLSESDKKHPVNARILTYEEANKWKEYKDLEEQGLLVRLPCPIGTTTWDICGMDIRENVVSGIEYCKDGKWFLRANEDEWLGELNDLVFFTREEAEKKLEELKNEI